MISRDTWIHTGDDLWYILGRSDDTIKVAGKRLGPAELESILNAHPFVSETAVIGIPDATKGEVVVCFCVLRKGVDFNESLRKQLINMIVSELGKPLKPEEIKFVEKLPKTRNAKVMHRVIRAAYLGMDPGDLSSLEDPQTVDSIRAAF
jgi:acetyl-CoA synthetase